jgi:hypothetical protein
MQQQESAATKFDLSTSNDFPSFVGSYENYPVSGTSLAISGLAQGTTYYYRVKAVYNDSPGAYSNPISTTTNAIIYLDAPLATDATAVSYEGFTARWEPVAGSESYRLDVFFWRFGVYHRPPYQRIRGRLQQQQVC